jgi:hypothetical protein
MLDLSNKPKYLILPHEEIFSEKFHYSLFAPSIPSTYGITLSNFQLVCWHFIIRGALAHRSITDFDVTLNEENFKRAQKFCSGIKGMIQSKSEKKFSKVSKALLFLEGLDYLPGNLVDTPFLSELRKKYNYTNNFVMRFNYKNYVLLYCSDEQS